MLGVVELDWEVELSDVELELSDVELCCVDGEGTHVLRAPFLKTNSPLL